MLSFGQGLLHPQAPGAVGGEPGAQSGLAVTPVEQRDRAFEELPLPTGPVVVRSSEALIGVSQGGGGYGDALDRPAKEVARDVAEGLVSPDGAARDYGVVADAHGTPDEAATEQLRNEIRRRRLGGREPLPRSATLFEGRRLSAGLVAVRDGKSGAETVLCARCGTALAAVGRPLMPELILAERDVGARGGFGGCYRGSERFVLRHFFCPGCANQIDVQIAHVEEPFLETLHTGPLDPGITDEST
jgi:N-methylhydantoinase B